MTRVLVTGGQGLIGRPMCEYLVRQNLEVRAFDLPTHIFVGKRKPIEGAENWHGSILDMEALSFAMRGCDYVVHLAALMGVENTERRPIDCLNININGTKNVLECAKMTEVKKVLFSSSSEIYGDSLNIPVSESEPPRPKSVYGVSKLAGEEYVKAYHKEYGLAYTIVRFFNVYGAQQVPGFVISNFINAVLSDQPIKVLGDGQQIRSFCYVDDAVRGAYLALFSEKAENNIFNIGNDQEPITIKELAYKVLSVAGKEADPIFSPEEGNRNKYREIFRRIPDISKARQLLGYEPQIPLEAGIAEVLKANAGY